MVLVAVVPAEEAQVAVGRAVLNETERKRVEAAVDTAEDATGMQFLVYIGRSKHDTRKHAERLLMKQGLADHRGILLLVSPHRRAVELVTSAEAQARINNDEAKKVIDIMVPAFRQGDWVSGVELGLSALVEAAGPMPEGETPSPEMPDIV